MKFRNIMLLMASFFILSMLSDLYYNLKINELSSDLEQINNEILQLEIEKSKVYLKHTEEFSIGNIEKHCGYFEMNQNLTQYVHKCI